MKVAACIFDLDGVLCDTSKFHFLAWSKTAQQLGVDFSESDNHQLKGVSRVGSLQYILDKGKLSLSQNEFDRYLLEKNDNYISMISDLGPQEVGPGVKELFNALQKKNIKIGLGSSSKNARMVVDQLGLTSYFQIMVDGNDVVNSKPHPEVFLKGAKALEVKPENCIVFEDAPKGAQAARNGGFWCIGIGGSELEGLAHVIFPDMNNTLETILDSLKLKTQ